MVLAKKGMVLTLLVFATLFLASPMAMVNASKTTNDFYLKAYTPIVNIEWSRFVAWQHSVEEYKRVLFHITEVGIVKDDLNVEVGTITLNIVAEVLDIEALTGTLTAKYEINFYSGGIIMGTLTAKVLNAILPDMEIDGKFVGHGEMNVMGDIYFIWEGTTPFGVFDGYSW